MEISWSLFVVISSFLLMGGEVQSDCTEDDIGIEGGNYTLTKGLQISSLLVYHCPENYYPYPDLVRACYGRWKPQPNKNTPQSCRLVECPDPNVQDSLSVLPPQDRYFVGNVTTYECYSGYKLQGSVRRVCLSNGKWSGHTPICSRGTASHCPNPGIPPGATRTGDSFDFSDVVKYRCNRNLFLVGSKTRTCQDNTQWTGREPACFFRYTYDTPLEVSEAFGSAIKGTLTKLESTDDTQLGKKIRITKDGTLNIYIAVDISESIEVEQIQQAKDAVLRLISKISYFSVTPNYEIVFFTSEVFEVVRIVDGKTNLNTIQKNVTDFSTADRSHGTNLAMVFKTFYEKMSILKVRLEDAFNDHRHVILLFTDGGFNIGGSPKPTVARIKNLVYMNHTSLREKKDKEEYLDIYVFAIGKNILDDELQPLTTGTGGRHYFRLNEIKNLDKAFDEIIDEEEVVGLCGLHRTYGTDRANYPWHAFISILNEDKQRKCIGSLVTPKFVLTAAHCFRFNDEPRHIKVEIDDGDAADKTVRNYRIHPKYNVNAKKKEGVKEFYDYDVALIELEEAVDISSSVRPICIPCTQETSDALHLTGVSNCTQQEELLLSSSLEKLNFLTRHGEGVKEKDVVAKLGNNRQSCIIHALTPPEITAKDPEVVVTKNFLCTGGDRDHIACTGDSGGAVFKNYNGRTIQIGVVSFGNKDLCKERNMPESDETSRDFHLNLFKVVPFLKSILGNNTQNIYAPLKFLST